MVPIPALASPVAAVLLKMFLVNTTESDDWALRSGRGSFGRSESHSSALWSLGATKGTTGAMKRDRRASCERGAALWSRSGRPFPDLRAMPAGHSEEGAGSPERASR